MDERDWLAERFEDHRTHLRAVAHRMLGSSSEADDAVQLRADTGGKIVEIDILADPERLDQLDLTVLHD